MSNRRIIGLMIPALILFCAVSQPSADVVHESKSQIKLSGPLGTISKIFGLGKPLQTIDYYSGNKMRSDVVDKKGKAETSKIIDLDKELFITLDHKKQTYTEITFEQWRQALEAGMAGMKESKEEQSSESAESEDSEKTDEPETEWTVSFDVSRPKGTENINGKDAEKLIMTVDAKEKPKTLADTAPEDTTIADMRMTSTSWFCPDLEGSDEIDAFNKKLVEKLGLTFNDAESRNMWEQIMQTYPQIRNIADTLKEKSNGLEGTPVRSDVTYEIIGQQERAGQEEQKETPTSLGGLMKGFGKKAFKKHEDSGPKPLIEITNDLVRQEVTPVDQSIFTVPENYKAGE